MYNFYINQDTCSRCNGCVEVCPLFIIEKRGEIISFKEDFLEICMSCGHCMAICPTKSIYSKGLDYEKDFFEFSEKDDFFSLIETRRSCRRFKAEPLKREEIEKLLWAISQAPHSDKEQHVEISVINSREKIMEALPLISKFYDNLEKCFKNPFISKLFKLLIPKEDYNTLKNFILPHINKGIYRNIGYDYDGITRGAHTLLIFHAPYASEEHWEDSYIFTTYATLTAHFMGLGSTIIGLIPPAINRSKKLKEIFKIPKENVAVSSIVLGHPKYKFKRGIKKKLKNIIWV
ncbi:MAG: nitroreductase family protein [Thermoanaerobaculia bacterium]